MEQNEVIMPHILLILWHNEVIMGHNHFIVWKKRNKKRRIKNLPAFLFLRKGKIT